jgi:hypothetical protein
MQRPQLGLAMLAVITLWASAEATVGTTLVSILRDEARDAIEDLIQCRNSVAQRKLLLTHAQHLPADQLEALEVLLALFSRDQSERNNLVHWQSGVSPQIPDGILLLNPAKAWHFEVGVAEQLSRSNMAWDYAIETGDSHPLDNEFRMPSFPRNRVFVYTARDFNRMAANTKELINGFTWLNWILREPQISHAHGYDRLRALPRYLPELERLRADRSTPPPPENPSQS